MHLFEDIYCGGVVVETLSLTVYNSSIACMSELMETYSKLCSMF